MYETQTTPSLPNIAGIVDIFLRFWQAVQNELEYSLEYK